jgi:hypothetical protein
LDVDELADGGDQLPHAPVDAAAELLRGERRQPAFHEVQPGGIGRGEVRVDPWVP